MLLEHLLKSFMQQSGIDLKGDTLAMQRLREAAEAVGPANAPEALGRRVANMLLDAGAGELLNV